MTPDKIFQLCSTIAMIGWIVLIILPHWQNVDRFLIGIIITLFCLVYVWIIVSDFRLSDMSSFGSLDGVMQLFTNKSLVTAGWVHYLAFDLMTGIFIRKNAQKNGISHWVTIPCLLLTFMLGPVGLLLYLLIRWIVTRIYFADNY
jgi:hypothetical protein